MNLWEATYAVIVSNANFNGMDSPICQEAAAENDKSRSQPLLSAMGRMYIDGELDNAVR